VRTETGGKMLEKDIVNSILKYLKSLPECFAWKEHGGMYGTSGIPDIIVCYRGKFVAFEVKTPSGKLTMLQEITLRKINAAKGNVYKVTSLQEVKEILKNID
jgi:penicillin-binding protein-related factor A (putative recombinase)